MTDDVPSDASLTDDSSTDDSLVDVLDARRAAILVDLTAAAGGQSLCSISRSAGSVPSAKYLEGRLSAVGELKRLIRGSPGADPAALLAQTLAGWRDELDRVTRNDRGPDWIGYRAGGVDELTEMAGRDRSA